MQQQFYNNNLHLVVEQCNKKTIKNELYYSCQILMEQLKLLQFSINLQQRHPNSLRSISSGSYRNLLLIYFLIFTFFYLFSGFLNPISGIDPIQGIDPIFQKLKVSPEVEAKLIFAKSENNSKMTSSQIKYRSTNFQKFQQNLLQKHYQNDPKFLLDRIGLQKLEGSKIDIKDQKLGDLASSANSKLKNPNYPQSLKDIFSHEPLKLNQLPFCLFVRLSKNNSKQFNLQVVSSVFNLNYSNYIINFYGDHPDITRQQIELQERTQSAHSKRTKRMYYSLKISEPNYYQYRYMMHELCVEKSIVKFVSSVINKQALHRLVHFHRTFPIYLTYSSNSTMYFVHSFQMRIFDLLFINDFQLTNEKYFDLPNQQKLFAIGITELSSRFTKRIPVDQVYENGFIQEAKVWVTANSKADKQIYRRKPYQLIFSLSQNYQVNQEQIQNHISSVKRGQFPADNITELKSQHLKSSLEQQQALYLPDEHLLYQKMYNLRQKSYGRISRINKPNATQFPKNPFCVVALGKQERNKTVEQKERYISSMLSILNQKYSNFHIVYIDDGLSQETRLRILQKAKQFDFLSDRFKYVTNKRKMFSTFNIVRAAFDFCQPNQMLVPIQSDIIITDPYFLNMINNIKAYEHDYWIIYTGYKIDRNKVGYTYRLRHDSQYRGHDERVKGLKFISPVPAIEVRLIKNIPLSYHQDKNSRWLQKCWLKNLQHSIAQLSSVWRTDYIPQIEFTCPSRYIQEQIEQCLKSDEGQYIQKLPYLMLLNKLETENDQIKLQVQSALRSQLEE